MLDIDNHLVELSKKRQVFHSEADFQFALAWQIKQAMPRSKIRLEFNPVPEEGRRMALDIWIATEGVAMELKYTTRNLEATVGGERFVLRNHGAQPPNRYDYLRDVQRLEREVATGRAERGFAVLLTNDPLYWKPPQGKGREIIDDAFRIHEGRELAGKLAWSTSAGKGTTRGRDSPIRLTGRYHLHYRDYSELAETRYGDFRYLVVSVG